MQMKAHGAETVALAKAASTVMRQSPTIAIWGATPLPWRGQQVGLAVADDVKPLGQRRVCQLVELGDVELVGGFLVTR